MTFISSDGHGGPEPVGDITHSPKVLIFLQEAGFIVIYCFQTFTNVHTTYNLKIKRYTTKKHVLRTQFRETEKIYNNTKDLITLSRLPEKISEGGGIRKYYYNSLKNIIHIIIVHVIFQMELLIRNKTK